MPMKLSKKTTGNPEYSSYSYGSSANVKEDQSKKWSSKGGSGKQTKAKSKKMAY